MKSLIFTDTMVRAILSGAKTMTRRVVTPPRGPLNATLERICAPLTPGDAVYVREAWQWASLGGACAKEEDYPVWRATDPDWATMDGWRWRSPLHLRQADARLFLRIEEVRAERLWDISEEDIAAEGVRPQVDAAMASALAQKVDQQWTPARMEFWALWESIHGEGSWERDLWLWVYRFRRITREEANAGGKS